MPCKAGNIELYMGPSNLGAPDDLEQAIVDFINGAQERLDIAVQELESMAITKALVEARKRKVVVRLVIEQDYLRVKKALQDPFQPGGENETNRMLHDAVLRANVDVKVDYNGEIFHQKFIVRDRESLLTGSTNFTETCTHNNLNHIVIIHDEGVAKTYSDEYDEIQQGHFGKLNEGHDQKPPEITVSGVPLKVLFAPDHNPEMEIMKQMLKGKKRIDFAIFTFAKSSGIDDTMIARVEGGIEIRGAMDGDQARQQWAATPAVKAAGVKLYSVDKKPPLGKLHHKLMVIDEQVLVVGSFNYTGPANLLNDENIIVIGDLETTAASEVAKQKKLAKYALDEIDRIITTHGKPI
jgi:phosphatidylserine/phosphatidylglycerophosphate/cardiolipin synthase-like enzyme